MIIVLIVHQGQHWLRTQRVNPEFSWNWSLGGISSLYDGHKLIDKREHDSSWTKAPMPYVHSFTFSIQTTWPQSKHNATCSSNLISSAFLSLTSEGTHSVGELSILTNPASHTWAIRSAPMAMSEMHNESVAAAHFLVFIYIPLVAFALPVNGREALFPPSLCKNYLCSLR